MTCLRTSGYLRIWHDLSGKSSLCQVCEKSQSPRAIALVATISHASLRLIQGRAVAPLAFSGAGDEP